MDATSAIGEPVSANVQWAIHPLLVYFHRAGVA
jgi:hypothetical protein